MNSISKVNKNIKYFLLIALFFFNNKAISQTENVPISNSVYLFLNRLEAQGYCKNLSLSSLPLTRNEVISVLKNAYIDSANLDNSTIQTLKKYLKEFEIEISKNAVVFYSSSDSSQVFFDRIFSNDEKYVYRSVNSKNAVYLEPLFALEEYLSYSNNKQNSATLGQEGFRLRGTIDNTLGFYLQATNGSVLSGSKEVALMDPRLRQNVKFAKLNSDFDFTESHVRYQNDWFYAGIGRESKLIGAGFNQHIFQATGAPANDAIYLGCKFNGFEYRFSHASLIGVSDSNKNYGYNADFDEKYLVTHRLSARPSWGEFSFWEGIIYSGRQVDLAYLNPLSFFKSLEHALHDRDNSLMGFDFTIRPIDGLIIKGAYLLDDIIFGNIGKNYWNNKSAFNVGLGAALPYAFDISLEYARVEPYTFSHFNKHNSYSNDSLLIGGLLQPNSDETTLKIDKWWGERYPITFKASYLRAGKNIYNNAGELIENFGSDIMQTRRFNDKERFPFLSGEKDYRLILEFCAGIEIVRNLSFFFNYSSNIWGSSAEHFCRIALKINEF